MLHALAAQTRTAKVHELETRIAALEDRYGHD
jgi:BMFP domain-containing protein YqiC